MNKNKSREELVEQKQEGTIDRGQITDQRHITWRDGRKGTWKNPLHKGKMVTNS